MSDTELEAAFALIEKALSKNMRVERFTTERVHLFQRNLRDIKDLVITRSFALPVGYTLADNPWIIATHLFTATLVQK